MVNVHPSLVLASICTILANMLVNVLLNHFTNPLVCGWYVLTFLIPKSLYTSNINFDKNAFPQSDSSSPGTPCQAAIFSTCNSAMVSEL